jgi:ribonuclease P protein component
MAVRFGFRKKERLKSRKAIDALFTGGKSLSQFPLRCMYAIFPAGAAAASPVQAGVSVSKKHFKKAVHRNRIKRLVREAYRLQKVSFTELVVQRNLRVHLFFLFVDKHLPAFETIRVAVAGCLAQLEKIIQKHESPA